MKTLLKILIKIIFIVFAISWVFKKLDIESLTAIISKANVNYLIISIAFSGLSLVVSGFRSHFYFKAHGLNMNKKYMVYLYFVGTFFNIVLPGGVGGDGYKVYHVNKKFNFSKLTAFKIILCERTNGFYILCLMGFILYYFSSFEDLPYNHVINTIGLIIVTPCYLLGNRYVLRSDTLTALHASLYSLVVQLLQVAVAITLLKSLYNNASYINYVDFTLLFIIASILSIIPVSIGGIGIRELTFLYGLEFIGDPELKTLGVAFAMMTFAIYALVALLGLPLYYKLRYINHLREGPT